MPSTGGPSSSLPSKRQNSGGSGDRGLLISKAAVKKKRKKKTSSQQLVAPPIAASADGVAAATVGSGSGNGSGSGGSDGASVADRSTAVVEVGQGVGDDHIVIGGQGLLGQGLGTRAGPVFPYDLLVRLDKADGIRRLEGKGAETDGAVVTTAKAAVAESGTMDLGVFPPASTSAVANLTSFAANASTSGASSADGSMTIAQPRRQFTYLRLIAQKSINPLWPAPATATLSSSMSMAEGPVRGAGVGAPLAQGRGSSLAEAEEAVVTAAADTEVVGVFPPASLAAVAHSSSSSGADKASSLPSSFSSSSSSSSKVQGTNAAGGNPSVPKGQTALPNEG